MEQVYFDFATRYTKTFIVVYAALILFTWIANILAVLIDLWTGIDKAKAKGEPIQSGGLRKTITKVGDYWAVQLFGLMIDIVGSLFWSFPFASMIVGLGILIIECRSVIENLREKKSAAAHLPDVLTQIIAARDKETAERLYQVLQKQKTEKTLD